MSDAPSSTPSPASEADAGSALLLQADHPGAPDGSMKEPAPPSLRPFADESPLAGLPMQLDVTVPIPGFRVQDLLGLEKDAVLETRWPQADDVPVWCGGVQLVWSEFEVVDRKLAVRVTRLV
jgi:flagellar motor switch protein FliN/FliY